MYERHIDKQITGHFNRYKEILVVLGSRQVGKTTLLNRLFPNALYLMVDNEPVRRLLESYDINTYKSVIKSASGEIIIDEIHLLSDPGRAAKIIHDQMPEIKLILTGSSSFHIKHKTGESLAGRKIDYHLYPLTFQEYLFQNNIVPKLELKFRIPAARQEGNSDKALMDIQSLLNNILLYGLYPNMVNYPGDKKYLLNFVDSLIYKDIVELNLIDNKRLANNLLKLLAYQIGNIINYSEIAEKTGADSRTIRRYIEIFEQCFIIYRLFPYSGNKRNEIVKSPKIYFYDTGIRNALIDDFSSLEMRPDKGALFENFIINEIIKANAYLDSGYKFYFWRNKQGSEVDLILEKEKKITGIEIKYGKANVNKVFVNQYPLAEFLCINSDNFW